jgi:hypothetical protein
LGEDGGGEETVAAETGKDAGDSDAGVTGDGEEGDCRGSGLGEVFVKLDGVTGGNGIGEKAEVIGEGRIARGGVGGGPGVRGYGEDLEAAGPAGTGGGIEGEQGPGVSEREDERFRPAAAGGSGDDGEAGLKGAGHGGERLAKMGGVGKRGLEDEGIAESDGELGEIRTGGFDVFRREGGLGDENVNGAAGGEQRGEGVEGEMGGLGGGKDGKSGREGGYFMGVGGLPVETLEDGFVGFGDEVANELQAGAAEGAEDRFEGGELAAAVGEGGGAGVRVAGGVEDVDQGQGMGEGGAKIGESGGAAVAASRVHAANGFGAAAESRGEAGGVEKLSGGGAEGGRVRALAGVAVVEGEKVVEAFGGLAELIKERVADGVAGVEQGGGGEGYGGAGVEGFGGVLGGERAAIGDLLGGEKGDGAGKALAGDVEGAQLFGKGVSHGVLRFRTC